jgi:AcrR family transcriptional regulator
MTLRHFDKKVAVTRTRERFGNLLAFRNLAIVCRTGAVMRISKVHKIDPTDKGPQVNFRTRTGRVRRARTRANILSAAFEVFDSKGVGRATVEDVRERAGLARGSFYNYFQTYEGMLKELAAEIARQINAEQSERFEDLPNLAERLWSNVRYSILRVSPDRSCAEVLVRVTPLVGSLTDHMRTHAEREMQLSSRSGVINVPSTHLALDLGYGFVTMMLRRALDTRIDKKEIEGAGLMLLRAWGVEEAEARRISRLRVPRMPETPLRAAVLAHFGDEEQRVLRGQ